MKKTLTSLIVATTLSSAIAIQVHANTDNSSDLFDSYGSIRLQLADSEGG